MDWIRSHLGIIGIALFVAALVTGAAGLAGSSASGLPLPFLITFVVGPQVNFPLATPRSMQFPNVLCVLLGKLTAVQLFIKNVLRPAQTSQPGNGTEVIEKTDMNQRNSVLLDYLSQPFQIMETTLVVIGDLYLRASFTKSVGQAISYLSGKYKSYSCATVAKFLAKSKMNVFLTRPGAWS